VVFVVLHVSGTPNPTLGTADQVRCLSFEKAEALGLDITTLREDYTVAVEAFPNDKARLAESWTELQYTLRDQLQKDGQADFIGRSMFSIIFFEPDGRIAWVFYRGLESEEEPVFCEIVTELSEDYRFPLESEKRFSQCGTTHFSEE
jgi:hypothetical protein